MRWTFYGVGYEAKTLALEAAQALLERGRICCESTCLSASEVAFPVEFADRTWEVGYCVPHSMEFACTPPGDWVVGPPRRLDPEDVLNGLGDEESAADAAGEEA